MSLPCHFCLLLADTHLLHQSDFGFPSIYFSLQIFVLVLQLKSSSVLKVIDQIKLTDLTSRLLLLYFLLQSRTHSSFHPFLQSRIVHLAAAIFNAVTPFLVVLNLYMYTKINYICKNKIYLSIYLYPYLHLYKLRPFLI